MSVKRRNVWLAVAAVVVVGVLLWRHFGLGGLLTLESLKASRDALAAAVAANPLGSVALYFVVYVAVAALSLPGAAILTLAGGALFGLGQGLVVVSFASAIGALVSFLIARYLLRDAVQRRFGKWLDPINQGMQRDGAWYLLTLRLVPLFPFFAVNLLAALTPIAAWRFYWVSQLGMLAGTAVYVNAGTQLASIQRTADIFSPALLGSFVLLGLFPLLAKFFVDAARRRKLYAKWQASKPKRFDRNLVVIGAGAGGLVTAYIAAVVKAKVTLVESHRMGGDCLNYGCVPSKALIRSAKLVHEIRRKAEALGLREASASVDFAAVMDRIQDVVRAIEPHDSVERYTALGVDVVEGYARITSPWSVEITRADGSKQTLTTRSIVIATGAALTMLRVVRVCFEPSARRPSYRRCPGWPTWAC
jgi:uncharacterized membrane protein YdjX (TVP38/TMEM64 family)